MQLQEVNWLPFIKHLENILGVPVRGINLDGKSPSIICQDLTEYVGFLKHGLAGVSVGFFNFKFWEEPQKEGGANLWATVYINLEHKTGGNNQVHIFTAWYYDEEGWIFASPAD